jgi:4-carboxymuconolactone decarboxylase
MPTRDDLRAQAEATSARLLGPHAPASPHVPAELADLLSEITHGGVWSRPGLAMADRMLATIAALAVNVRLAPLKRQVGPALDLGLTPLAIQEICLQSLLYSGFANVEDVFAALGEVFVLRGIAPPPAPRDTASLDELSARGTGKMHEIHGTRAQQGYADPANAITGALYPAAIRYGYGALWFRPGLTTRQRALVSVAAFTAARMAEQVRKFGQSAVNAGATREEVVETIVQTAPYSGFPPALNALAALGEAWR